MELLAMCQREDQAQKTESSAIRINSYFTSVPLPEQECSGTLPWYGNMFPFSWHGSPYQAPVVKLVFPLLPFAFLSECSGSAPMTKVGLEKWSIGQPLALGLAPLLQLCRGGEGAAHVPNYFSKVPREVTLRRLIRRYKQARSSQYQIESF